MNAEVRCTDGIAGRSTYVVGNPNNHQITHLVVRTIEPPFHEYLVPIEMVDETTPDRIRLNCTLYDLYQMKPFEVEVYVRTEIPGYVYWSTLPPVPGYSPVIASTYIPVSEYNISQEELALRRGARVEASDGYIGTVDELLINSNNNQLAYIVLHEEPFLKKRKISIPISQIERVIGDTVYLKLDRQAIEKLPTTPKQRWPRKRNIFHG